MISTETFFVGAAIHGIALVLLLAFNRHANRMANRLLAVLAALLTIAMWNVFAYRSDDPFAMPIIDIYLWATPCLWAPTLYQYVGELTKLSVFNWRRFLLHALPAIAVALLQILLHLQRETETGAFWLQLTYVSVVAFVYPQIAVYFLLSIRQLKTYQSKIKETHSAIETINLAWLKVLILLFSAILVADMSMNIPAAFFGVEMPALYDFVLFAEAVAVFAIGYLSLRQPEIVSGVSLTSPAPASSVPAKYLGSPVDHKLGAELAEQLDGLMEQQQVYLNNDLKLAELGETIGLSPHHLSQVINQHRHKNFYDYVNTYRARFAADYLIRHGKTNLTQLAFDSGFNNRVSFNSAFKKHTGLTPSAFIKRHNDAQGAEASVVR